MNDSSRLLGWSDWIWNNWESQAVKANTPQPIRKHVPPYGVSFRIFSFHRLLGGSSIRVYVVPENSIHPAVKNAAIVFVGAIRIATVCMR